MEAEGTSSLLTRSLSETAEKQIVSDNELKEVFFQGLSECWEDGVFCDVKLIANDRSVRKANRLVLACISPYFKALFSQKHNGESKTQVELRDISAQTLDLVLRYGYTSKVEVTGDNVQDLTVAANFLQLSSLENLCSQFISQNIDASNFIEVMRFAEDNGLMSLEKSCNNYMRQNLGDILPSPSWLALDILQIERILKSDSIRVFDSSKVIPPSSIQERILLGAVLRYAQEGSDRLPVEETLSTLFRHIRLHLIWKYELEAFRNTLDACEDKKIVAICHELLSTSVTKKPGTLRSFADKKMPMPRLYSVMKPVGTGALAHGYVGNYQGTFYDRVEGVPRYIKGMKIWIRRWDGRPVFGAIEVRYSDGENVFHGQISDYEVYEFMLEPDEFITKVISSSGYMIDNLEFVTNKGKSYGPYGGDGGGRRVHTPAPGVDHGYLSFVTGAEAFTQSSLGIVSLSFHWIVYDFEGKIRVYGDDLTPKVILNGTGAFDIEYDQEEDEYYSSDQS